jgi:hypothetical protein
LTFITVTASQLLAKQSKTIRQTSSKCKRNLPLIEIASLAKPRSQ